LQSRHNDAGVVQLDLPPKFNRGGKIRIVEGAFAAYPDLYKGIADSDRVAILLDLLGRKVWVVFDRDAIAAA